MESLEEKLAQARKSRASKILDGAKVDRDNAAIAALETEIQIQNDVAAEKARREREAAKAEYDKETAVKLAQLEAMIGDDLQDAVEAEAGARQLAAAISR